LYLARTRLGLNVRAVGRRPLGRRDGDQRRALPLRARLVGGASRRRPAPATASRSPRAGSQATCS
jgi:hypothetical protein